MQPILEMRGITKTFPGVKALTDVNLSVMPAEIHAVVGENGAGKSTLMKVLSGVYPHGTYDGQIFFEGTERKFGTITDSEDTGIIIIHQELALVPLLSIAENIFLGHETAKHGVINWFEAFRRTQGTAEEGRPQGTPQHADHQHRHRQAAARRNRQGAEQEGQAADPRRADLEPQRNGFQRAAGTAARGSRRRASPRFSSPTS